ncbi:hypothetical protein QF035_009785 [Streptomyces umbrinus]|uniref:Uncharacterized protein n=1 Tax=Streptomyces umbrinus TaxID=67370 RepID=A0ABU0T8S0_9ACTN|nr:hypothetical protein [Streptomyces umbrinus]
MREHPVEAVAQALLVGRCALGGGAQAECGADDGVPTAQRSTEFGLRDARELGLQKLACDVEGDALLLVTAARGQHGAAHGGGAAAYFGEKGGFADSGASGEGEQAAAGPVVRFGDVLTGADAIPTRADAVPTRIGGVPTRTGAVPTRASGISARTGVVRTRTSVVRSQPGDLGQRLVHSREFTLALEERPSAPHAALTHAAPPATVVRPARGDGALRDLQAPQRTPGASAVDPIGRY